jgi:2-dehydro-3-deoxyphosphogluconate aldolase/(4S)-4-hydroxy-2-oxoglutarate aldolase
MNVSQLIRSSRLVAIVRLDDLSSAVPLMEALLAGGIVAIEFTLTNPQALDVIQQGLAAFSAFREGTAALGLGSVRSVQEAREAIACGAQFVVTPICQPKVIELVKESGRAIAAGAMTPTEMSTAWDAGADFVKVFPAKNLGPGYIRDVLAPMPYLPLLPTGGVDLANMKSYLDAGAVAVGMGGHLLDGPAIVARDWTKIREIARQHANAASPVSDDPRPRSPQAGVPA